MFAHTVSTARSLLRFSNKILRYSEILTNILATIFGETGKNFQDRGKTSKESPEFLANINLRFCFIEVNQYFDKSQNISKIVPKRTRFQVLLKSIL